jgi:CheY-like chemotaxis protein
LARNQVKETSQGEAVDGDVTSWRQSGTMLASRALAVDASLVCHGFVVDSSLDDADEGSVAGVTRVGRAITVHPGRRISRRNHIVLTINHIQKQAGLAFMLAVGRLIIDSYFDGDLGAWHQRGQKDVSFRKLAEHPDLNLKATALYYLVGSYEMFMRLGLEPSTRLSPTHLRCCLPLPQADQARLLLRAEAEHWTVEALMERIQEERIERRPYRGGRPRQAPLRRVLGAIDRCVQVSNAHLQRDEAAAELSPETTRDALEVIARARATLSHIEQRLPLPERGATRSAGRRASEILVIDDDAAVARTFVRILSSYGHVTVASNVQEAAEALGKGDDAWDVILIDVLLSDGNGLSLLARYRTSFPASTACVLVVTGGGDATFVNEACELGAACMLKPFTASQLERFLDARGFRAQREASGS